MKMILRWYSAVWTGTQFSSDPSEAWVYTDYHEASGLAWRLSLEYGDPTGCAVTVEAL